MNNIEISESLQDNLNENIHCIEDINKIENIDILSSYDYLDTGDIILYDTSWWYSRLIQYFSDGPYSHISIVLKKPTWLDEKLTEKYYILESGSEKFNDSETGRKIFGVQIVPLDRIIDQYKNQGYGKLYYRKLKCSIKMEILQEKIKLAYFKIQAKPYDLDVFDWIKAYSEVNKDINDDKSLAIKYQKINKFWCSALVSYIYVECELLDKNIPWTIVSPNNFYYKYKFLPLLNCKLKKDKLLI
jgi:hypothetical protein